MLHIYAVGHIWMHQVLSALDIFIRCSFSSSNVSCRFRWVFFSVIFVDFVCFFVHFFFFFDVFSFCKSFFLSMLCGTRWAHAKMHLDRGAIFLNKFHTRWLYFVWHCHRRSTKRKWNRDTNHLVSTVWERTKYGMKIEANQFKRKKNMHACHACVCVCVWVENIGSL